MPVKRVSNSTCSMPATPKCLHTAAAWIRQERRSAVRVSQRLKARQLQEPALRSPRALPAACVRLDRWGYSWAKGSGPLDAEGNSSLLRPFSLSGCSRRGRRCRGAGPAGSVPSSGALWAGRCLSPEPPSRSCRDTRAAFVSSKEEVKTVTAPKRASDARLCDETVSQAGRSKHSSADTNTHTR